MNLMMFQLQLFHRIVFHHEQLMLCTIHLEIQYCQIFDKYRIEFAFQRIQLCQLHKLHVENYIHQNYVDQFFHFLVLTKACPNVLIGKFHLASYDIIFQRCLGLLKSHFLLQYHKYAILWCRLCLLE